MGDSDELPADIQTKLLWLRTLTNNLPSTLPTLQHGERPKYPFHNFQPDGMFLQWMEDEVGAINEMLKNVFGWKSWTTGDGIITIEEHGKKGIGLVADVLEGQPTTLEHWYTKWLQLSFLLTVIQMRCALGSNQNFALNPN
ncbi:hypothetical protein BT96DRAFT_940059 [Gymnopus androsaceus JB14]|uniref:Uncharacterized protein n=1 Tax=Gymnopus androsaceus JB14 TaxID=1447944 RepID=A0A6A4HJ23_9AGAR|nr:hypothetical protein BT96DRAFT_940059 [Gymnopus androsaceus JB14]